MTHHMWGIYNGLSNAHQQKSNAGLAAQQLNAVLNGAGGMGNACAATTSAEPPREKCASVLITRVDNGHTIDITGEDGSDLLLVAYSALAALELAKDALIHGLECN